MTSNFPKLADPPLIGSLPPTVLSQTETSSPLGLSAPAPSSIPSSPALAATRPTVPPRESIRRARQETIEWTTQSQFSTEIIASPPQRRLPVWAPLLDALIKVPSRASPILDTVSTTGAASATAVSTSVRTPRSSPSSPFVDDGFRPTIELGGLALDPEWVRCVREHYQRRDQDNVESWFDGAVSEYRERIQQRPSNNVYAHSTIHDSRVFIVAWAGALMSGIGWSTHQWKGIDAGHIRSWNDWVAHLLLVCETAANENVWDTQRSLSYHHPLWIAYLLNVLMELVSQARQTMRMRLGEPQWRMPHTESVQSTWSEIEPLFHYDGKTPVVFTSRDAQTVPPVNACPYRKVATLGMDDMVLDERIFRFVHWAVAYCSRWVMYRIVQSSDTTFRWLSATNNDTAASDIDEGEPSTSVYLHNLFNSQSVYDTPVGIDRLADRMLVFSRTVSHCLNQLHTDYLLLHCGQPSSGIPSLYDYHQYTNFLDRQWYPIKRLLRQSDGRTGFTDHETVPSLNPSGYGWTVRYLSDTYTSMQDQIESMDPQTQGRTTTIDQLTMVWGMLYHVVMRGHFVATMGLVYFRTMLPLLFENPAFWRRSLPHIDSPVETSPFESAPVKSRGKRPNHSMPSGGKGMFQHYTQLDRRPSSVCTHMWRLPQVYSHLLQLLRAPIDPILSAIDTMVVDHIRQAPQQPIRPVALSYAAGMVPWTSPVSAAAPSVARPSRPDVQHSIRQRLYRAALHGSILIRPTASQTSESISEPDEDEDEDADAETNVDDTDNKEDTMPPDRLLAYLSRLWPTGRLDQSIGDWMRQHRLDSITGAVLSNAEPVPQEVSDLHTCTVCGESMTHWPEHCPSRPTATVCTCADRENDHGTNGCLVHDVPLLSYAWDPLTSWTDNPYMVALYNEDSPLYRDPLRLPTVWKWLAEWYGNSELAHRLGTQCGTLYRDIGANRPAPIWSAVLLGQRLCDNMPLVPKVVREWYIPVVECRPWLYDRETTDTESMTRQGQRLVHDHKTGSMNAYARHGYQLYELPAIDKQMMVPYQGGSMHPFFSIYPDQHRLGLRDTGEYQDSTSKRIPLIHNSSSSPNQLAMDWSSSASSASSDTTMYLVRYLHYDWPVSVKTTRHDFRLGTECHVLDLVLTTRQAQHESLHESMSALIQQLSDGWRDPTVFAASAVSETASSSSQASSESLGSSESLAEPSLSIPVPCRSPCTPIPTTVAVSLPEPMSDHMIRLRASVGGGAGSSELLRRSVPLPTPRSSYATLTPLSVVRAPSAHLDPEMEQFLKQVWPIATWELYQSPLYESRTSQGLFAMIKSDRMSMLGRLVALPNLLFGAASSVLLHSTTTTDPTTVHHTDLPVSYTESLRLGGQHPSIDYRQDWFRAFLILVIPITLHDRFIDYLMLPDPDTEQWPGAIQDHRMAQRIIEWPQLQADGCADVIRLPLSCWEWSSPLVGRSVSKPLLHPDSHLLLQSTTPMNPFVAPHASDTDILRVTQLSGPAGHRSLLSYYGLYFPSRATSIDEFLMWTFRWHTPMVLRYESSHSVQRSVGSNRYPSVRILEPSTTAHPLESIELAARANIQRDFYICMREDILYAPLCAPRLMTWTLQLYQTLNPFTMHQVAQSFASLLYFMDSTDVVHQQMARLLYDMLCHYCRPGTTGPLRRPAEPELSLDNDVLTYYTQFALAAMHSQCVPYVDPNSTTVCPAVTDTQRSWEPSRAKACASKNQVCRLDPLTRLSSRTVSADDTVTDKQIAGDVAYAFDERGRRLSPSLYFADHKPVPSVSSLTLSSSASSSTASTATTNGPEHAMAHKNPYLPTERHSVFAMSPAFGELRMVTVVRYVRLLLTLALHPLIYPESSSSIPPECNVSTVREQCHSIVSRPLTSALSDLTIPIQRVTEAIAPLSTIQFCQSAEFCHNNASRRNRQNGTSRPAAKSLLRPPPKATADGIRVMPLTRSIRSTSAPLGGTAASMSDSSDSSVREYPAVPTTASSLPVVYEYKSFAQLLAGQIRDKRTLKQSYLSALTASGIRVADVDMASTVSILDVKEKKTSGSATSSPKRVSAQLTKFLLHSTVRPKMLRWLQCAIQGLLRLPVYDGTVPLSKTVTPLHPIETLDDSRCAVSSRDKAELLFYAMLMHDALASQKTDLVKPCSTRSVHNPTDSSVNAGGKSMALCRTTIKSQPLRSENIPADVYGRLVGYLARTRAYQTALRCATHLFRNQFTVHRRPSDIVAWLNQTGLATAGPRTWDHHVLAPHMVLHPFTPRPLNLYTRLIEWHHDYHSIPLSMIRYRSPHGTASASSGAPTPRTVQAASVLQSLHKRKHTASPPRLSQQHTLSSSSVCVPPVKRVRHEPIAERRGSYTAPPIPWMIPPVPHRTTRFPTSLV